MQAWQATVQDDRGNALPNPVVTVYESDGTTEADIFNEGGTALPNPLTGDLDGFVQFYASPGNYKVDGGSGTVWDVDLGALELAQGASQSYASREEFAAALPDLLQGSTALVGGQPYVVDSAATGYSSALQDLGVDGVRRPDRLDNLFLASHFTTQSDTTVRLSLSLDGVNFTSLNSAVLPGGPDFGLSQRDPSICWFGGWWWIFGTGNAAGSHDFVLYRSRDLTSWSKYQIAMAGGPYASATVPMPGGVSPASALWAPEPFIEDGRMFVMLSIRYGADFTNIYGENQISLRPYLTELTSLHTPAFSAPVEMVFGPDDHSEPETKIDASVLRHGDFYYCAVKDDYYRRIQIYRATSLVGPWTYRRMLTGGTMGIEAPCFVRVRDHTGINTEAPREKFRVYVDNNRTSLGDPNPNSLVGAPYYFETTGLPDEAYGPMTRAYFDVPVRHGSIINLAESPPEATADVARIGGASGGSRRNLGRESALASGTGWIRPQPDMLYYVDGATGSSDLAIRNGPADRFYMAVFSADPNIGISVRGEGSSNRSFLLGFGRSNDQVVEMRRRGSEGGYYPSSPIHRAEFRAHRGGTAQNFTAATDTIISWNTVDFNHGNTFDAANDRWVPPVGRVDLTAQATVTNNEAGGSLRIDILRNGTVIASNVSQGTGLVSALVSVRGNASGGADSYQVRVRASGTGSREIDGAAPLTLLHGVCW